jgi:hypothetical protein
MGKKRLKADDFLDRLKTWAVSEGAEYEAPTNPYELLRLRVNGGVAIVWKKDSGKLTWNPLSARLKQALITGSGFPADLRHVEKTKVQFVPGANSVTHRTLIHRDGEGCFFCFEEKPGEMTLEHLVPRTHGGPDHISNKFRACSPCNMRAGHLSAPEKIKIRDANLLAREAGKAAA